MLHCQTSTSTFFTSKQRDEATIFVWYIVYGKMIHHTCIILFYCVVTIHFALDSNLNSNIHCSIWNPIFKSIKSNSWFRNWCWDAVQSAQALEKSCIQSTNQNAIPLARTCQFQIWSGWNMPYFFVYKAVDMLYTWIVSWSISSNLLLTLDLPMLK